MPVTVLIADDSAAMRAAVTQLLMADWQRVTVVGVASTFAELLQMMDELKPEVLLMDLRLPQKTDFTPEFVKVGISSVRLVAMSVLNDDEARELATTYGALVLLDKMNLFGEVVPAILRFAPSALSISQLRRPTSDA
jgi:DNA-binding NarL/FixJ family response regulator